MQRQSAATEWRAHWPVVLAAGIGISFSALPLQSVAFFADPLQREFDWSHTQMSLGLAVFSLSVIPFAPFAGALQDRFGARRVAITGILLCILALGSFALTTGAQGVWLGQWALLAFAELPLKGAVFLGAVSAVFVLGRGLAVGVALCGTALAQTLAPVVSFYLIDHFGWRAAYALIAVGWGGVALLMALLVIRPTGPAPRDPQAASPLDRDPAPGLTVAEALRSLPLYRITFALTVSTATSLAVLTNKVAILAEFGVDRADAAAMAATAGAFGVAGKLFTGWAYDHLKGTWINVQAFAAGAAGFLIFLSAPAPGLLILALVLFGYGGGATLQASIYLMSRYGGMRNFGKIFGTNASILALGMAGGPIVAGMVKDATGSFHLLFLVCAASNFLCVLAVTGLGPFPDWMGAGKAAPAPRKSEAVTEQAKGGDASLAALDARPDQAGT